MIKQAHCPACKIHTFLPQFITQGLGLLTSPHPQLAQLCRSHKCSATAKWPHLQGIPQDPCVEAAARIPPSLHSACGLDAGSTYFAFVVFVINAE